MVKNFFKKNQGNKNEENAPPEENDNNAPPEAAAAEKKKKEKNDILHGMAEICQHINLTESTIVQKIRDEGFPAKKESHEWVASRKQVDIWRKKQAKK
jgi:hypothetical protein